MVFSIVKLTTNTGISDQDVMIGIPNVDDVKRSKLYRELIEDCGCSKYILVTVKSIAIKHNEVKLVLESHYVIIPEEYFMDTRRTGNEVQRRNQF